MNTIRRLATAATLAFGLLLGASQPAAAETVVVPAGDTAHENNADCVFVGYLLVPHGDHYDVYEVWSC